MRCHCRFNCSSDAGGKNGDLQGQQIPKRRGVRGAGRGRAHCEFYGNAEKFWLIADANTEMDPEELARPGNQLLIPPDRK